MSKILQLDAHLFALIGFLLFYMSRAAAAKSLQSCPTLCDAMDCSLPGFSVHGIFQARVLEWGAIAFSMSRAISTLRQKQSSPTLEGIHLT